MPTVSKFIALRMPTFHVIVVSTHHIASVSEYI